METKLKTQKIFVVSSLYEHVNEEQGKSVFKLDVGLHTSSDKESLKLRLENTFDPKADGGRNYAAYRDKNGHTIKEFFVSIEAIKLIAHDLDSLGKRIFDSEGFGCTLLEIDK